MFKPNFRPICHILLMLREGKLPVFHVGPLFANYSTWNPVPPWLTYISCTGIAWSVTIEEHPLLDLYLAPLNLINQSTKPQSRRTWSQLHEPVGSVSPNRAHFIPIFNKLPYAVNQVSVCQTYLVLTYNQEQFLINPVGLVSLCKKENQK